MSNKEPFSVDSSNITDESSLETIRSILLHQDREQLSSLVTDARQEIRELQAEVAQLKSELTSLEQSKADSAEIVPTIQNEMANITSSAVQQERRQMAEAIGPMISAATKVQIRESKDDMADALAPVMLGAISSSIQEALKDFQRNFDAQMSQRAQSNDLVRRIYFTSRGTSEAEAAVRAALPYELKEIFLIQKESGLLLSHWSSSAESTDSDLVSAMLTAIRDFVGDAFSADGQAQELNEIQYGEQQIVIKNGAQSYAAAVVEGIVPAGLGAQLQLLVSDINSQHGEALHNYNGDSDTLPDLDSRLAGFSAEIDESTESAEIPRDFSRLFKVFGLLLSLLFLAAIIVGIWFFVRLLPLAWQGVDQPTSTITTAQQLPTVYALEPFSLYTQPDEASNDVATIPEGATLELMSIFGTWRQVRWQHNNTTTEGWVSSRWITSPAQTPFRLITPTP